MLVSAAMAERPRATSGGSRPATAAPQASGRRVSTARVSTTHGAQSADGGRRSELPSWFWGALGCLTVLVVGLTVVFFLGQPGTGPAPATAPQPAAAAPAAAEEPAGSPGAPEAQRTQGGGIHVEPMAPPPAAIDQVPQVPAAPAVKQKAPAHPVKIAKAPAGGSKPAGVAAAKPAAEPAPAAPEKKADDSDDEPPKPAKARTSAEDEADER